MSFFTVSTQTPYKYVATTPIAETSAKNQAALVLDSLCNKILKVFTSSIEYSEAICLARELLIINSKLSNPHSDENKLYKELTALNAKPPLKTRKIHFSNLFALTLANDAFCQFPPLSLPRGFKMLLQKVPVTRGWLAQLLPVDQKRDTTERLLRTIISIPSLPQSQKNIISTLYAQLKSLPTEKCSLTQSEKLNLCIFTALKLGPTSSKPPGYYTEQMHGLPIHLQHDATGIYIPLKNQPARSIKPSEDTLLSYCLHLFYDPDKPMEYAIRQIGHLDNQNDLSISLPAPQQQLPTHSLCNNVGIWPIFSACDYEKHKTRIFSIVAPFGHVLDPLAARSTTTKVRFNIAKQLCKGLCTLHENSRTYKNLETTTILYKKSNGEIETGFFGISKQVDTQRELTTTMQSFGKMLSKLFFQKDISNEPDSPIMWLADLEIELPANLPPEKQLKRFIRKLLRSNPDSRPTSHEALEELIRLHKIFSL